MVLSDRELKADATNALRCHALSRVYTPTSTLKQREKSLPFTFPQKSGYRTLAIAVPKVTDVAFR